MGLVKNVLFLCTGNSARSIMAEAILNQVAPERFRAWSAGSHPKGAVHLKALELLQRMGHETRGLHSKSWDAFAREPHFDFIFTVCDNAAHEVCPVWPGHPMTAHWGQPDPAAADAAHQERAFRQAYLALENRIRFFASLPIDKLDRLALKKRLDEIGQNNSAMGEHAG